MKNSIRAIAFLAVAALGVLYFFWYIKWKAGERAKENEQVERMGHGAGINCANNLEQLGLAFRIWSGDHGGKMPFNMSTNEGGTLELCSLDNNGFDQNAYLFLRVLSNELGNINVLICPLDHEKKTAANWASLTSSNISYRFHSGTNINVNTKQVLAVCPIDGNILYSDGTIEPKQPIHQDMSGQVPVLVQEPK